MSATNAPTTALAPPRGNPYGHGLELTPERCDVFVETLRATGSLRAAAAAASPHLAARGSRHCSVGAFMRYAERNPEFAERIEQAKEEALGKIEATLRSRVDIPDRRPVLDRQGNIVGWDESWRSANALGLRIAERLDPEWAPRQAIKSESQVTVNRGSDAARSGVMLTAEDIRRLPPQRQQLLLGLLDEIYAAAETAKALPAPEEAANG